MAPSWLLERLRAFGDRAALVWQDRHYGYDRLVRSVDESLARLSASGVRPGDCVAVRGSYSPGTCSLLLALIVNRNVVVPWGDAGHVEQGHLQIARVRVLISFDAADAWTVERLPTVADHPLLERLRNSDAAGLILFTSGSTGGSKVALLDFDRLLERFRDQRRALCTLMFMASDHIGGINTLFHVLADGGTAVPVRERTPQAVCRSVERHQCSSCPPRPPS